MIDVVLTPWCTRVPVPDSWPSLGAFAKWWWRAGCPTAPPAFDYYREHTGSRELVLFRRGQFQVEQVTLLPGFPVPNHCHPNVETYEHHIYGAGEARVDGLATPVRHDPRHPLWSRRLHIPAGVWHRGIADSVNVALSVQRWADCRPPTFITDDWLGEAPWR